MSQRSVQKSLVGGHVIDTCALIHMWFEEQPPEVFPGLWRDIERLVWEGRLVAPQEVLDELMRKEDALLKWAKSRRRMFAEPDKEQARSVAVINMEHPTMLDPAKPHAEVRRLHEEPAEVVEAEDLPFLPENLDAGGHVAPRHSVLAPVQPLRSVELEPHLPRCDELLVRHAIVVGVGERDDHGRSFLNGMYSTKLNKSTCPSNPA